MSKKWKKLQFFRHLVFVRNYVWKICQGKDMLQINGSVRRISYLKWIVSYLLPFTYSNQIKSINLFSFNILLHEFYNIQKYSKKMHRTYITPTQNKHIVNQMSRGPLKTPRRMFTNKKTLFTKLQWRPHPRQHNFTKPSREKFS